MVKAIPQIGVINAKNSIEYYKQIFDAKVITQVPVNPQAGKMMGLPEDYDYENSTMHAEIDIAGARLYLFDLRVLPSHGNVEIALMFESKEEIETIWAKVKKCDYKIIFELATTFWGGYLGKFENCDGITWQLEYEAPPSADKKSTAAEKPPAIKKSGSKAKKSTKKN